MKAPVNILTTNALEPCRSGTGVKLSLVSFSCFFFHILKYVLRKKLIYDFCLDLTTYRLNV